MKEGFRYRGIGRALVEAVVAGAPAETFVADCDVSSDGFFNRCGFAVSAVDGRDEELLHCVRSITVSPAPAEAVGAVTLGELEAAIRASWGSDTSADPAEWTTDNPARGQYEQLEWPSEQEPLLLGDASERHTLLAQRVSAVLLEPAPA